MSAPAAAASHELLERDDELDRLAQLTADAARGRGAVVVLEGPAGIGKTSLLEAARRLADAAGLGVLAGRGGELERDFAYGVVRQLLERHVGRADRQQRERWLEGAAALAGPMLGLASERHIGDDPTAAALHGLYWLMANVSADTPLLVAVDDLHWVDGASLRFLAYLARRVAELPILLLAASRPPIESHTPALVEALVADPCVCRVEPAPLSLAAVQDLVTRRGRGELAESFHAATGGNPFLVGALLDVRDEQVTADDVPVVGARSVIRFVAGRLGRLGPDVQALARAVAVLGTDAEPRHAYAIAELTEDAGVAAEDALVAAGILAARATARVRPPDRSRRRRGAALAAGTGPPPPRRGAPPRSETAAMPSASPPTCSPPTREPTTGWWRRWPPPPLVPASVVRRTRRSATCAAPSTNRRAPTPVPRCWPSSAGPRSVPRCPTTPSNIYAPPWRRPTHRTNAP